MHPKQRLGEAYAALDVTGRKLTRRSASADAAVNTTAKDTRIGKKKTE
jgi:hypothetical protein